jgi:hypothetical protein
MEILKPMGKEGKNTQNKEYEQFIKKIIKEENLSVKNQLIKKENWKINWQCHGELELLVRRRNTLCPNH